jgi:NADH:ubiquinone oxidoreductase subunit E
MTQPKHYDLEHVISEAIERYEAKPTALIMVLQDIQKHYHYLPIDALRAVASKMNLPIAQIYGVATFYKAFSLTPKGKHHICVCSGTACHVRQANVIIDHLRRELNTEPGHTTADGELSFETVNCFGACAVGPLVTVDDEFHGNVTVSIMNRILEAVRKGAVVQSAPAAEESSEVEA